MKKMLIIVLCITFCVVICTTSVMAKDTISTELFEPSYDIGKDLGNIARAIIAVFQVVGTIVAIATLLYLGIKLMLASPSERADIKSRAVPYIVGSVMLFAIVNLLQIVASIMSNVTPVS